MLRDCKSWDLVIKLTLIKPVNLSVKMPWTEVAIGGNSCVKAVAIIQSIRLTTKFYWLETSLMTFCPALTARTDAIAWTGANKTPKAAKLRAALKNNL